MNHTDILTLTVLMTSKTNIFLVHIIYVPASGSHVPAHASRHRGYYTVTKRVDRERRANKFYYVFIEA